MKTIILTGGAGYIGSHTLIELLTKTDYQIIAIDNFSNSSPGSYERVKAITNKNFTALDLDLCDSAKLNASLSGIKNIEGI